MIFNEIMSFLKEKGSEQTRKIYQKHGASGDFFGVKSADYKIVQKKVKIDHPLAMELFSTKNGDAQYLGGLIADSKAFTKEEFETCVQLTDWYFVLEYSLAWNLGDSSMFLKIFKEWIDSDDPRKESCAWGAMCTYLGITANEDIDFTYMDELLIRIEKEIHTAKNRTRYTMNNFIIALGATGSSYTEKCKAIGERIGKVEVNMGETSCKVPLIKPYLKNMEDKGRIGKKKKNAKS